MKRPKNKNPNFPELNNEFADQRKYYTDIKKKFCNIRVNHVLQHEQDKQLPISEWLK